MSPSPFAVTSPTDPASYSWEATDEAVAERFGIPVEEVLRFDLNTSPAPPDLVARLLAGGPVRDQPVGVPARGLPEPRRGGRLRLRRHDRRDRPGRRCRRDPGHVHQGLPARRRGRRDLDPDVRDVQGPRRAAWRQGHHRPAPSRGGPGWAMDAPAVRDAAREARLVWICNPNNPTGLPEPDGAIEALLERPGGRRGRRWPGRASRRRGRGVQRVHRAVRDPAPDPVSEPRRRPDGVQGLRAGRPPRRLRGAAPTTLRRIALYRPPGSIGTISATVVAAALRDESEDAHQRGPRVCASVRAWPRPRGGGLASAPSVDQLHPARPGHGGAVRGRGPRPDAPRPRAAHVRPGPPARPLPPRHRPRSR